MPSKAKRNQSVIPEDFRKQYKKAASMSYNTVSADSDRMSRIAWIEVIQDAGRIRDIVERQSPEMFTPEFREWLKANESNPEFMRDQDRAVSEIL